MHIFFLFLFSLLLSFNVVAGPFPCFSLREMVEKTSSERVKIGARQYVQRMEETRTKILKEAREKYSIADVPLLFEWFDSPMHYDAILLTKKEMIRLGYIWVPGKPERSAVFKRDLSDELKFTLGELEVILQTYSGGDDSFPWTDDAPDIIFVSLFANAFVIPESRPILGTGGMKNINYPDSMIYNLLIRLLDRLRIETESVRLKIGIEYIR